MKSTVTVIFGRPVVPLTSLGNQASLPQPLKFTPSVIGDGEWLNTSIYEFTPKSGFEPATKYRAYIQAGLQGLMGSTLEDDYAWTFTTKLPAVEGVSPRDQAIYVGPEDAGQSHVQPADGSRVRGGQFLTRRFGEQGDGRREILLV